MRAQSLGPHLRLDKKEFVDIELKESQVFVLTRSGCSFCQQQLKSFSCFRQEDVIVLFDGTEEEWKKEQRRHLNPYQNYLVTIKSRDLFKKKTVYPTSLRYKKRKILRYEGVRDCQDL